jgi:hypothetical protein
MMLRWFSERKRQAPGERDLEDRLRAIDEWANTTEPPLRAHLWSEAGDLCAFAARPALASRYYGRSVDAYLLAEKRDMAAALCRKIVSVDPAVVRARYTLALLAVADPSLGEAGAEIEQYIDAAERAGVRELLIPHLRFLARIADQEGLIYDIAHHLQRLGDAEGAEAALAAADEIVFRRARHSTPMARWNQLVRAALAGTGPATADCA